MLSNYALNNRIIKSSVNAVMSIEGQVRDVQFGNFGGVDADSIDGVPATDGDRVKSRAYFFDATDPDKISLTFNGVVE